MELIKKFKKDKKERFVIELDEFEALILSGCILDSLSSIVNNKISWDNKRNMYDFRNEMMDQLDEIRGANKPDRMMA